MFQINYYFDVPTKLTYQPDARRGSVLCIGGTNGTLQNERVLQTKHAGTQSQLIRAE